MAHSNLTRWIESAEARKACEAEMFHRASCTMEGHYLHLGEAIAKVPSWISRGIGAEHLASIGCHAVAYIRRPFFRAYH